MTQILLPLYMQIFYITVEINLTTRNIENKKNVVLKKKHKFSFLHNYQMLHVESVNDDKILANSKEELL